MRIGDDGTVLQIRLHDAHESLAADGLNEGRLALYMPAQRLSLTAGPLRLLDGDFARLPSVQTWSLAVSHGDGDGHVDVAARRDPPPRGTRRPQVRPLGQDVVAGAWK